MLSSNLNKNLCKNIVICENPAGDKQIAIELIPIKYLETQFKSEELVKVETLAISNFNRNFEEMPGFIDIPNNEIQQRNLHRENLVHQVVININLDRESNVNVNRNRNILNENDLCFSHYLYLFCKYICCGTCIILGIILDKLFCNSDKGKQLAGSIIFILLIITILTILQKI